jgi:hypothetical protein
VAAPVCASTIATPLAAQEVEAHEPAEAERRFANGERYDGGVRERREHELHGGAAPSLGGPRGADEAAPRPERVPSLHDSSGALEAAPAIAIYARSLDAEAATTNTRPRSRRGSPEGNPETSIMAATGVDVVCRTLRSVLALAKHMRAQCSSCLSYREEAL